MRKKKIKQRPSTTSTENTNSSMQPRLQASDSPSFAIYQSIVELPLSRFIDLQVNDNYYSLVISGEPVKEVLAVAAQVIRQEYADMVGDHEYKMYCTALRQINDVRLVIEQVKHFVALLRKVYHPAMAKAVNSLLKSNLVFDVAKRDEYDRSLDRAMKRLKGVELELDLKLIAFKKLEAKYADGKKPTRDYYMGVLITLSDDAGYSLTDQITVWEYCERLRRLNKKHEQLQLQQHGRRKN
jgi:hypothetical protein